MAILITDPSVEQRLKTERRDRGINGQDEVWNGTYIISVPVDDERTSALSWGLFSNVL